MADHIDEFRAELKTLLKKYDASIGFSVSACSDTFGLYDECIVADFGENSREDVILAEGWHVDHTDL